MLMLYLLQVWLGRYIHRRRAEGLVPANKPHPPSNILHVCLGLLVMTLAFFQVHVLVNTQFIRDLLYFVRLGAVLTNGKWQQAEGLFTPGAMTFGSRGQ